MKKQIFYIYIIFIVYSCGKVNPNQTIDEGKVDKNLYTSEEIGWTIRVPDGWDIVSMEQKKLQQEKGYEILKDAIGEDFDCSQLKNLIGFKKDAFNMFQSTSEPFDLEYEGEWEQNNQVLKELMYTALEGQGIKIDSTATTIEKVDGLDFHSFGFTIYSPERKAILYQIVYSRLINGFDFSVNINYNSIKFKNEILNAWLKSKFKK
ncbi:hypothetical protein [Dysgonomonas sp.]